MAPFMTLCVCAGDKQREIRRADMENEFYLCFRAMCDFCFALLIGNCVGAVVAYITRNRF